MTGGTGSAIIAGSTILNNAELIGGVVFAQLIEPGAAVDFYKPILIILVSIDVLTFSGKFMLLP